MSNRLPHHKIGVIVPIARAARAEEAVRYGVAPNLVSFGAMFIRRISTGQIEFVAAATLAFNVYSAHMYPTLLGYCADVGATTSIEAMDRHYRYDADGALLGGYQVLKSRDASGKMQEITSPAAWIAGLDPDLELATDIEELMPAMSVLEGQAAPTGEELATMRATILAGLSALYSGASLEDIAEQSSIGVALLELAAARGG